MSKRFYHRSSAYGAQTSSDQTLLRTTVHGSDTVSSSAGGIIQYNISLDPSTAGGSDWSDFSSTYDEFRVMGVRVTVFNRQFGVAVNGGAVAIAFDNDSGGNPASFTAVQQYSTCRYFPAVWTGKPISFTWWRPTKGLETAITWDDVANPSTSLGSIPIYASGLSASTSYFQYVVEFFVEFRGRR